MNYLLDTCVISELTAKRSNPQVIEWIDRVEENHLYVSAIAIGEIQKGIEKLTDQPRKAALQEWLTDQLLVRFGRRIVPIDVGVMLRWGQLTGALEAAGKKMPAIDSLIAASALHSDLVLVTRNEDDFKYTQVRIANPWKPIG